MLYFKEKEFAPLVLWERFLDAAPRSSSAACRGVVLSYTA